MGVTTVDTATLHLGEARNKNPSRLKSKALKALELKPRFVLGHDVFMDKVETLCRRALIGRLEYCSLSKEEWVDWATIHWKPVINYVPTIILLANNCLMVVL